jgi:uncharacterized protein
MTVESTIDYEGLAQEAMRGVVRKVLARAAKSGLPGDHHFYVSFDTEAPGVSLSRRLKEKYPHEMTIVLQHRFWDLIVSEDRFEVKLTFDGIPERLIVPFDALKVFFDPSVRFGLQFEDPGTGPDAEAEAGAPFETMSTRTGTTRSSHARKSSRPRKPAQADNAAKSSPASESALAGQEAPQPADEPPAPAATPFAANGATNKRSADAEAAGESSNDKEAPPKPGGAEIVSLDKFRKK